MSATVVLQSCPPGETGGWLGACLQSVRDWAVRQTFGYRFLGDELFDLLPSALRPGGRITPVIASDLARLEWARRVLASGDAQQVLWLDADVLVFDPDGLRLPDADYAVGREVWVQRDDRGRWRAWRQVHNASLFFRGDATGRNTFLDFYAETAARLLSGNAAPMPAQFIGPKLLTALHNVVQLPVLESVGMISPALAEDLLGASNGALACFARRSDVPLAAANLCRSGIDVAGRNSDHMARLVRALQDGVLPREAATSDAAVTPVR